MIRKFSDYGTQLQEARKETAVFAFGRMNPPTIGHGMVVEKLISLAQANNADHFLFVSKTQDLKKNPLSHKQKVDYLKKFFPKANVPLNKAINPFDAVLYLCELGYKNIIVVTGDDHTEEYKKISTYKGKKDSTGKRTYSFDTFRVVVAGEARDENASGVAGMSASKMRKAAFDGNFEAFSQGVPGSDKALKKKLYSDVRKGMGLSEEFVLEQADKKSDVTILALTSSQNDLSDTVEKMEKICKKKGIAFYGVKTSKAQIDISSVASKKIKIRNYDGDENDVTIDPANTVCVVRGGVMNSDIGVAIMTILQNNGVFMVNERGGMELCANKLETAIALKKHDLPHPRTAFVANEDNIETAVKEVGGKFPIIVKTLTGAEGIGVSKIESLESLKSVLQTLWKYEAEVIIQEFLPNFKNDVRSIVLNGKIFACAKRDKAPKDFRTNIARGSEGGSHQLSDEEIKLVERAARVSKCYYVGIDHVINDGKPYIIEMNASPGSGNIYYRYYEEGKGKDNVKGEELVEDFVEYLTNKAHWKLFSNLAVRETVKVDGVEYQAKVDTGNSGYNMIHGDDIKDNGDHTVTFKLPNGKKVTKKIVSRITVKSGIGKKQRLVVLMDIDFHGKHYPNIKFSIGDRSHMSTKVLLGLQFLSKTGFTVDPSQAIYPQPEIGSSRKSEEEEEEELNEADLAFKGKAMKGHLDGLLDKIKEKHGTTDVTYSQAMKVVGSTGAARLAARGKIKRDEGGKEKGELGKTDESVEEQEMWEEFLAEMAKSDVSAAVNNIFNSPLVVKDVVELVTKRKSVSAEEYKKAAEKTKSKIMTRLMAAVSGAAVLQVLVFKLLKTPIGKVIEKKLFEVLVELGNFALTTSHIDPYIISKKFHMLVGTVLPFLANSYTPEDGDTIAEADIGKSKEYTTKTGKTKASPKDKETGLPKKYVRGLSKKSAESRKKKLAARKDAPDDDPKTWEFTDPKEKDIETKPSKYTQAFKKLAKKGGALKAIKNQFEVDSALSMIEGFEDYAFEKRINKALEMERISKIKGHYEAAEVYRGFVEWEKERVYENYTNEQTTLDEDVEFLMTEVSPPSGPARRFSKKEKVKKEFQKRYGKRWKEVMYATAWKMHNDSVKPEGNMIESAIDKIYREIVVEGAWNWTAKGLRGPLEIGTDKIVKTYKHDTPGERGGLTEVADEEKDAIYKEWSKLVNMSAKELSDFIDSEEGEEAGLSRKEAGKAGAKGKKIKSGRDSARAIVRMLERKKDSWTDNDWEWAKRQINFINRMSGAKGKLREPDGKPTRKLLALKIWGNDPEKK